MLGKRFEKEFNMMEKAIKSEKSEKEFRVYVKPYLESVVDEYISKHKITKADRATLIKVGWTHFSIALKKYYERALQMQEGKNDIFYFNTYFNWYIRQAIIEYLNTLK